MIEAYKISSKKYDPEIEPPLKYHSNNRTRGNSKKLAKDINRSSRYIRKLCFSNRVVNLWNELPDTVVNAPSVISFESRLDKYWTKYRIKFDFDKCVQFEAQKMAGIGTTRMVSDHEKDLET